MKKLFFTICTLSLLQSGFGKEGAYQSLPTVIFKFSPQHMIRSGIWLSGEVFNDNHKASNQVSLEAIYSKPANNGSGNGLLESTGFTAEYMFRYYTGRLHIQKSLHKEYVKGFYIGLFGQAGSYKQRSRSTSFSIGGGNSFEATVKTTTFYPGFLFGIQQSIGESIYLDMYFGAGMHIAKQDISGPDGYYPDNSFYFLYNNGVLPKIGLSIGFGI